MISLLVAMDCNQVIGYKNGMPWHLPKDLKHFKEITTGHAIIMGRKTFDSIGRILPERRNIIITNQEDYSKNGAETMNSLEELYELEKNSPEKEFFVVGGGNIYKQVLPYADRMYITMIDEAFKGDTYFPTFDDSEWKVTSRTKGIKDKDNPYDYYFLQYDRN